MQAALGWALVLGASSGLGAASAMALAEAGYDVCGVHLGMKDPENARQVVAAIESTGRQAIFRRGSVVDTDFRSALLDELAAAIEDSGSAVGAVVHSVAFGVMRPFVSLTEACVDASEIALTLDVMATSLVTWTQDLFRRGLLVRGARIFAMTSAGAHRQAVAYGAVSAAKAALEAYVRQLAMELAPHGISVNAIQPGVTDTAALRKIPGHERLLEDARRVHPDGKLTEPRDVGNLIASLCRQELGWVTGAVIRVDGGEDNR